MSKKIRILIVEDDKKFADSLLRILSEEGYQCMLAEKPQTAISLAKIHSFDLAIIDCMLPQMNGIDLSLRLKENNGDSMVIFLMSGIYKDKNFSTTALKKTGAEAFLLKPFEIPELIMQIQSTFKNVDTDAQASLKTIKGLIGQENLSQNIIYTIINSNPIINGNELPFIINSLMAYKCQGVLNIHTEKSSIELQFNESRIYQ